MRQPLTEMGHTAAAMLSDLIESKPIPTRRVELATELIIRESTAPPSP